jgi:hypothetical protein
MRLSHQELYDAIAWAYEKAVVAYTNGEATPRTEVGKVLLAHLKDLLAVQLDRARGIEQ